MPALLPALRTRIGNLELTTDRTERSGRDRTSDAKDRERRPGLKKGCPHDRNRHEGTRPSGSTLAPVEFDLIQLQSTNCSS